jgi:anti-anti-sigma regulatory factor
VASNFQIFSFKTRDSLHLKLSGDFDGNSAYELINTLAEHGKGSYEIFIDTNELNTIHPFGKDVFQKNIRSSNKLYRNLVFLGKNGHEIGIS